MQKTISKKNGKQGSQYDLQADFENIKEALAEATEDMRGRVGEILSQSVQDVKKKSSDVKNSVSDYISDQPFKSLGIAVASGFILGFMFRK